MIKKIFYFITILLSLLHTSETYYKTKSYIDEKNNIYSIQNYCNVNNVTKKNCYTISKFNLDTDKPIDKKKYYRLNKKEIKNDFNDINLNKLLSNNN